LANQVIENCVTCRKVNEQVVRGQLPRGEKSRIKALSEHSGGLYSYFRWDA
jgi:hypothetical protein